MDIGSIFLILALLVLVGLFISRPFFEGSAAKPATGRLSNTEDHELSSLLAEHDRILNALQELDFDHALGKIPAEDYPTQRTLLLQHGADVLRKLDRFQADIGGSSANAGASASGSADGSADADAESRIEAVIAARRADARMGGGNARGRAATAAAVAAPDDDLETLLANRRRSRQEKAAGFCPQCGGTVQKSDRFCPKCGRTLA